MKTFKTTLRLLTLAVILISTSCTKDEDSSAKGAFSDGIFIVNEGAFPLGTGTITFYDPVGKIVKQDIFENINGRPLGNIAQSMTLFNGKGYIVVNNASKVEVVDVATFKSVATISELSNPSQFLVVDSSRAYVSDWVGQVSVIDLKTNTISKNIIAGTGPDVMLKSGNYVYVANTGGYSADSTVTVIDFTTDKVIKTIKVGDVPSGLVVDGNGRIWVMCKGRSYVPSLPDTPGQLVSIDPVNLTADIIYKFVSTGDHPEKLMINKQKSMLYFLFNSGIYSYNIALSGATPEKLVSRYFYGLGYENKTGYLYASDAKNFNSNGVVLRIKADDGSVVDSIQAGIVPRGFTFPE